MLYQLEKLTDNEKLLVHDAPALVTILIAGADNDFEDAEIRKSISLVHVKSYSESADIAELYKEIEVDHETELIRLMGELPSNQEAREKQLIDRLSDLNAIFAKMDSSFAHKYYDSLVSFSGYIARAAGGVFGVDRVSPQEEKFVRLPMLQDPKA